MTDLAPLVLGRQAERDRVERFLHRSRPASLILEGEAGIGKTTLWRLGVERARGLRFEVLGFRAGEAERALTFAGLTGLLPDRLLDQFLPRIPEPRRQALEVALLRRAGAAVSSADFRTVAMGVVSVFEEICARAPLLVAIDDAQWLDEPTERILEFAFRRLPRAEVAALIARRTDVPAPGPLPLERAFPAGSADRQRLTGMPSADLAELVRDRLGVLVPRAMAGRLHRESAGNPFLALEMSRAAAARGGLPGAGEPFPLPADAASLVSDRLARVSPGARQTLAAIAALAQPTTDLLARALGEEACELTLAELAAADLVRVDGEHARCAHPLIASAAYASALPSRRMRLHARLAEVVPDEEEAARHLALGSEAPDEQVADRLEAAAGRADARGAPGAAGELLERARALTPETDPESVWRRTAGAAACHVAGGNRARARELANEVVAIAPAGPARSLALRLLGEIAWNDEGFPRAIDFLRRAQAEAGTDLAARTAVELDLVYATHGLGDLTACADLSRDVLADATELGDQQLLGEAMSVAGIVRFLLGGGLDEDLLRGAAAMAEPARRTRMTLRPDYNLAFALVMSGRLGEARERLTALIRDLAERGEDSELAMPRFFLAHVDCALGDLDAAERCARESLESGQLAGEQWSLCNSLATSALVAALRGSPAAARQQAERVAAISAGMGWAVGSLFGSWLSGLADLAEGKAAEAAAALLPLCELVLRGDVLFPAGLVPFYADAVEALVAAGDTGRARLVADRAAASVAVFGPDGAPVADRCRGLAEAGAGSVERGLGLLADAVSGYRLQERPVEVARTLLARGQIERRARRLRAARESLAEALNIFERIGAVPWAERAREEMSRIGGRAANRTSLTRAEEDAVRLAVTGRTNREIAEELCLSVRTVESQLAAAYRKIGVRSRTELAAALARRRGEQENRPVPHSRRPLCQRASVLIDGE